MTDTPSEAAVEAVARAICRAVIYCDLDTPDGAYYWRRDRDFCLLRARAAIAAYNATPLRRAERAVVEAARESAINGRNDERAFMRLMSAVGRLMDLEARQASAEREE